EPTDALVQARSLIQSIGTESTSHVNLVFNNAGWDRGILAQTTLPDDAEPLEAWLEPSAARLVGAHNEATLRATCRLITNLSLYLNEQSGTAGSPRTSWRRAAGCPGERADEAPLVWVVGREIKLSREVREAARAYAERGSRGAAWRATAR